MTDTGCYEPTPTGWTKTERLLMCCGSVARYALSTAKPTIDQMKPIIDAGLRDAAQSLIEVLRLCRKYYAAAPMKPGGCYH